MKINGVLETCLYAEDLERAEAFYAGVLGLRVHSKEPNRHVFFFCGDAMLLLFIPEVTEMPESSVPNHGARGPGHVAFEVEQESLEGWKSVLSEHGVEIEQEVRWPSGTQSVYFRDPAGNSLELASSKLWGLERSV